jgi:putative GTP pyrophosphokinase
MQDLNRCIKAIIAEQAIELVEGPAARTWDNEYRSYFQGIGIETKDSENMYTSVHYILKSNSRTAVTCEIQVRTLMEEVWGEVDHSINYPHKTDSVPCHEQIRALARSTSSATRLVDAIFATVADIEKSKN